MVWPSRLYQSTPYASGKPPVTFMLSSVTAPAERYASLMEVEIKPLFRVGQSPTAAFYWLTDLAHDCKELVLMPLSDAQELDRLREKEKLSDAHKEAAISRMMAL